MSRSVTVIAAAAAALLVFALLLPGCEPRVGSERWCEGMKNEPVSEWSLSEARDYASHCLLPGAAIGSPRWCEGMRKLPKGDWSVNQATDYARYCLTSGSD